MQLITFIESDRSRAGILKEDGVIVEPEAAARF